MLGNYTLAGAPLGGTSKTAAPLAGNAAAVASATGALTTSILLSGAASAVATAGGTLTTAILLSGNAQAIATATGMLFGPSALAGNATAVATATGNLTTAILLAGNAKAVAAATGALTGAQSIEEFTANFYNLTTGIGITGASALVTITIRQEVVNQYWDFATNTVKTPGTGTWTANLTEANATVVAGLYGYPLDVSLFPDGKFSAIIYYAGSPAQTRVINFRVKSGKLVTNMHALEVQAAVGIASANIDSQFAALPAKDAAAVGLRAITATLTADQSQRVTNAILFGKVSGAGTATETFRNPEDTKNVCTITVDASGNRTLVVIDAA